MTIKYVGNRAFETRLAEFKYDEKEEKKADLIIELLRDRGYKVDDGVYGWAAIKVEDREEYEEVKKRLQGNQKESRLKQYAPRGRALNDLYQAERLTKKAPERERKGGYYGKRQETG